MSMYGRLRILPEKEVARFADRTELRAVGAPDGDFRLVSAAPSRRAVEETPCREIRAYPIQVGVTIWRLNLSDGLGLESEVPIALCLPTVVTSFNK